MINYIKPWLIDRTKKKRKLEPLILLLGYTRLPYIDLYNLYHTVLYSLQYPVLLFRYLLNDDYLVCVAAADGDDRLVDLEQLNFVPAVFEADYHANQVQAFAVAVANCHCHSTTKICSRSKADLTQPMINTVAKNLIFRSKGTKLK